jgi:hypothetical protein
MIAYRNLYARVSISFPKFNGLLLLYSLGSWLRMIKC